MKIFVRAKTGSVAQKVKKIFDIKYEVSLKSLAKDNKANMELVKVLKKYFGKTVRLKSGFASKKKIVEVED